jgi:hypothetical protein
VHDAFSAGRAVSRFQPTLILFDLTLPASMASRFAAI